MTSKKQSRDDSFRLKMKIYDSVAAEIFSAINARELNPEEITNILANVLAKYVAKDNFNLMMFIGFTNVFSHCIMHLMGLNPETTMVNKNQMDMFDVNNDPAQPSPSANLP